MGPEKARKNVRKIDVPTDTPTGFELGDTAADYQRRRKQTEKGERVKEEKQQREERYR